MTTRIIVGMVILGASISMAQQVTFSGTFRNDNDGTMVFYANGTVDFTFKREIYNKRVAVSSTRGSGTAGVVETKEQTVRGTFQVLTNAQVKELEKTIPGRSAKAELKNLLETYSEARGYQKWVLISHPAGISLHHGLFFVQNGRSLVGSSSGVVFKQAWYSR